MKNLRLKTLGRTVILIALLVTASSLWPNSMFPEAKSTSTAHAATPANSAFGPLNGDLDTSFDGDGKVTTDFVISGQSRSNSARAVAVQPNGKIVVVGNVHISGADYNALVARYNSDGSLDQSFGGGDGVVTRGWPDMDDGAYAVAIMPAGTIVVAGGSCTISTGFCSFFYAVFNPDGSNVIYGRFPFGDPPNYSSGEARAVAIQPDGKIVLAGWAAADGSLPDFALARLDISFAHDTSFGADGETTFDFFGGDDAAYAVAIQPDGKIVATGGFYSAGFGYDFGVIRLLSDGSLDSGFGGGGFQAMNFATGTAEEVAHGVALQTDGKIVLAGYAPGVGNDFGVIRLLSNGSLDTTFSGDGKVTTDFAGANDAANGVAIQPDGKIVLAGYDYAAGNDFALARLHSNGVLDASFSGDGKLTTDFNGGNDSAMAVAMQSDGKIVAVGQTNANTTSLEDFAIVRYMGQGQPDFSISATPASRTVPRPGRAQYSVVLTSLDGFSGWVTLSVSRLPSQTSGSFSPQTVFVPSGGSATATLTVATTLGSPQGTFRFTVTGTRGTISHAQNLTLIIGR